MKGKGSDSRYEFKLNVKEIAFFLVGSLGVISLFFIVGIWIGKSLNAVPSDIIKEEYVTQRDFPESDDSDKDVDIDDETVIDISKEGGEKPSYDFQKSLGDEEIIPLKESGKSKKVREKKSKNRTIKAKKEIDEFAVKKKAAPKIAVTRVKEVKKKSGSKKKGGYTVQVASLKSDKAALKLVSKLERKGYPAYFIAIDLGDKGVWYRVRVGNFLERDDADTVVAKIQKQIKLKGLVVKDSRYK